MQINRLLTNICSADLAASKAFYTSLFEFTLAYDSDWFVQLQAPGTGLEIGLIAKTHDIVPEGVRVEAGGMYLTIVVDDVHTVFTRAQESGIAIRQAPELMPYGQKRMLLQSPEGVMIDVSSPENN
ncbi:MAG: VOC family protein [Thiolinea sp.]